MRGIVSSASPGRRAGLAAVLLAALASSGAAAPILDLYRSDDLDGGVFLTGRWTEGFATGDPQGPGNGLHAGSWEAGASLLDSDWTLDGPVLASVTVTDLRSPSGDGVLIYGRTFDTAGATMVLAGGMPWTGPGDGAYTVALDAYVQVVTELYQAGARVFVRSSQSFAGAFEGHAGYRLAGQANWALVGDGVAAPAGYPAWRPAGTVTGSWGDVGQVRLEITPEPATLALTIVGLGATGWGRRRGLRGAAIR
jgi:hypothetical protein